MLEKPSNIISYFYLAKLVEALMVKWADNYLILHTFTLGRASIDQAESWETTTLETSSCVDTDLLTGIGATFINV